MKQKLWLTSVILILLTTLFCLTACADEKATYTVTFETNGGSAIEAVTVAEGESVTLTVPEKEGYDFVGWFTDAAFSGEPLGTAYTPTGNVTLYAKWSEKSTVSGAYVVTFETNGGSAIEAVTVAEGETVTLTVPKKEGYDFVGWFTDAAFSGEPLGTAYTPNGNVTLYAKWSEKSTEPVVFVVTFQTNGGGNVGEMSVESGNSIELPTPPPPRR